MLNDKLARIRDLIAEKERIDAELDALIAGTEPPKVKRGRPKKGVTIPEGTNTGVENGEG